MLLAAVAVAALVAPLTERGLLRFFYGRDEVLLVLVTYALFLVAAPKLSWILVLMAVSVSAGLGIILPDAYLSRRQNALMDEYRLIFPDLLDLLTVCMSAGLSIEASISRLREQMDKRSTALALNLELLGAEMRAVGEALGLQRRGELIAVPGHDAIVVVRGGDERRWIAGALPDVLVRRIRVQRAELLGIAVLLVDYVRLVEDFLGLLQADTMFRFHRTTLLLIEIDAHRVYNCYIIRASRRTGGRKGYWPAAAHLLDDDAGLRRLVGPGGIYRG